MTDAEKLDMAIDYIRIIADSREKVIRNFIREGMSNRFLKNYRNGTQALTYAVKVLEEKRNHAKEK